MTFSSSPSCPSWFKKTDFLTSVLALLVCAMLLSACAARYTFHGTVLDPLAQAHDFTLTDQHGQPFRLSDQRGKVVLLYFGYTSCPDVCPTTLAALAAVRRALGPDAQKVQVVFITVDPGRDTQEVIQRYLASFDPSFIGLRGTQAKLDPIIEAYGVTASADSHDTHAHDYKVTHSSYVYVIDPAGRWRMVLHEDDKVEDIVSDVRYLAQNEAS